MRDQIQLTDQQIEDRFNECVSVDFDQIVFTIETISDFKAARVANWSERGSIYQDDADLFWVENVQAQKGEQRRDLVVIDFGSVRAVARG